MSPRVPAAKNVEATRLGGLGRYDRVGGALRDALEALVRCGETVEVSPASHDVTTWQLFDLAREVREKASVSISWVDSGALTYALLPAKP